MKSVCFVSVTFDIKNDIHVPYITNTNFSPYKQVSTVSISNQIIWLAGSIYIVFIHIEWSWTEILFGVQKLYILLLCKLYAVKAQTSLAPLSWFHGSRVTTAHVHQCCIFQSYVKTVLSRMKWTMCEPASMTTDTWSRRVTSDFNSVLVNISYSCKYVWDFGQYLLESWNKLCFYL